MGWSVRKRIAPRFDLPGIGRRVDVAGDGVFDRQATFEAPNPHPGAFEVQVLVPHVDGFANRRR
jgi:hypothetical protein